MGMVIHSDYYEACMQLPKSQQAPFMLAIVQYGMEGVVPQGHPAWLPTFTAFKKRVKLGRTRAKAGSKGGSCLPDDAQANGKQNASKSEANDDQNEKQGEICPSRVEVEVMRPEVEDPFESPYGMLCLKALNEVRGTSYNTLPGKSARCLARMDGKYTVDEVKSMIQCKQAEWTGTQFARHLTPSTLFGPDHFEEYMNQSRSSAQEKSKYDQYD